MKELSVAAYTPNCILNLDNFQEFERLLLLHKKKPIKANIGLRINPQLDDTNKTKINE